MIRSLLRAMPLALVFAACQPTPPAPLAPRSATPVNASAGKTWDAVVDVFAERNIPIKNMERASGFIATDPLGVAIADATTLADCGKDVIGTPFRTNQATYTVLVRGDSTSATVKTTVHWIITGRGGAAADCTSKGVWERGFETRVKQKAETTVGAR